MQLISISDAAALATWEAEAERVHRQLRPHLPADYRAKMTRVLSGGATLLLAVEDQRVTGVAVYRIHENTADGIKLYVDDLVTDETLRSRGVGKALLAFIDGEARRLGVDHVVLDSGTQRTQAHKFYFREGFVVRSFNFMKAVTRSS